MIKLSVR